MSKPKPFGAISLSTPPPRQPEQPESKRSVPQFGASRPILWWMQMPYLWKPTWRESDIPEAERPGFRRRLAAKRAAGADGWGEAAFFGLYRKHNKHREAA